MFTLKKDDDPILFKPCHEPPTLEYAIELSEDLFKYMYEWNGVGLSANQVGLSWTVFVMDSSLKGLRRHTLINPVVVEKSKEIIEFEEGCLSYQGISVKKKRHKWIKVKYFNHKGLPRTHRFKDFESVIVQHELDHLNGIPFIDKENSND